MADSAHGRPPGPGTPRYLLKPLNAGPWLRDPAHANRGKVCALIGIGCFVVGAIGGGHGMVEAVAGFLLLGGGIAAVRGIVGWCSGKVHEETTQQCPECLASMPRGATTCPWCHFYPPEGT